MTDNTASARVTKYRAGLKAKRLCSVTVVVPVHRAEELKQIAAGMRAEQERGDD